MDHYITIKLKGMKIETRLAKIRAKFPIKAKLSKEDFEKARDKVCDQREWPGAETFKLALKLAGVKECKVMWGSTYGSLYVEGYCIEVDTKPEVEMMSITKPRMVTFAIPKSAEWSHTYNN